ncbi:MAG TPA: hypothetical protein VGM89_12145 [Puia sp.]
MKTYSLFTTVVLVGCLFCSTRGLAQSGDLRVVLLRHAEKPWKGDGLTCQGMNRSQELVGLLYSKFGLPGAIYIPNKGKKDTKRSRMYQTILPFASKYRLPVNADFHEDEISGMAAEIRKQRGLVLVVWEHSGLPEIAQKLGVKEELRWKDADYDSLWILRYVNGQAVMTRDKEGLHPSTSCP